MLKYYAMLQTENVNQIKKLTDEELLQNFNDILVMKLPIWKRKELFEVYKKITNKFSDEDKKDLLNNEIFTPNTNLDIVDLFSEFLTDKQYVHLCKNKNFKKTNRKLEKKISVFNHVENCYDDVNIESIDELLYEMLNDYKSFTRSNWNSDKDFTSKFKHLYRPEITNINTYEGFFKTGHVLPENVISLILRFNHIHKCKFILELINAGYKVTDEDYAEIVERCYIYYNTNDIYKGYIDIVKLLVSKGFVNFPSDILDKFYKVHIDEPVLLKEICEKRNDLVLSQSTINKMYLDGNCLSIGETYFNFYINQGIIKLDKIEKLDFGYCDYDNKVLFLLQNGYKHYTEREILKICLMCNTYENNTPGILCFTLEICELYFQNKKMSKEFIKVLLDYKYKEFIKKLVEKKIINETDLYEVLVK